MSTGQVSSNQKSITVNESERRRCLYFLISGLVVGTVAKLASPGIGKLANLIVNTVFARETIVTLIIIHKLDHSPQ